MSEIITLYSLQPPPNTFPRHRVFSTTSASSLTSHCSQALDYERISHLDNMLQDKQILYNVGQLGQVRYMYTQKFFFPFIFT